MVDITAGQGTAPADFPPSAEIGNILKRGDLALAFGVLTILVVLILPLPSIVLDLFLAISITLSILILMTSLFIQTPLEFSAFPTILLISTMLRLSLNLASTRLILSHGTRRHGRGRPRHRGLRQFRDERQFRHRHHRVRDPGDRELRRHHQGFGPHRRSRGALPPRRHARQADGDRRRPRRRPDRRGDRQEAPQGRWKTKAASSAPWTAPRNSCAATRSRACSSSSSTSSAASSSASPSRAWALPMPPAPTPS